MARYIVTVADVTSAFNKADCALFQERREADQQSAHRAAYRAKLRARLASRKTKS